MRVHMPPRPWRTTVLSGLWKQERPHAPRSSAYGPFAAIVQDPGSPVVSLVSRRALMAHASTARTTSVPFSRHEHVADQRHQDETGWQIAMLYERHEPQGSSRAARHLSAGVLLCPSSKSPCIPMTVFLMTAMTRNQQSPSSWRCLNCGLRFRASWFSFYRAF